MYFFPYSSKQRDFTTLEKELITLREKVATLDD